MNKYNNMIVQKPWGSEYIIYDNGTVAITLMSIDFSQSTSLHCHPTKKTGFILVSGTAEITLGFYNCEIFSAPSKTVIRPGFFHSTKAISENGVKVLELECPIDKDDIVRFKDKYGREGENYKSDSKMSSLNNSNILFEEPEINKPKTYNFDGIEVKLEKSNNLERLSNKSLDTIIGILDGGIRCKKSKKRVLTPGEVIKTGTIIKLSESFEVDDMITTLSVKRLQ